VRLAEKMRHATLILFSGLLGHLVDQSAGIVGDLGRTAGSGPWSG
jgi:hypothetical protein